MDPRERFQGLAERYARFRPAYPAALFDWLEQLVAAHSPEHNSKMGLGRRLVRVADIGCGTGISTRQLAGRGWRVVGVDPSRDMLSAAQLEGAAGIEYRQGEAASTGLPSGAFDLVTAAQAFHWFDIAPAMAEFRRLLRPGGFCAAFWNVRADTPALHEYERILRAYCPDYSARPRPAATIPAIAAYPGVDILGEKEFPHTTALDREGLRGRAFSSSYVALSLARRDRFEAELDRLFDRFNRRSRLSFDYRCRAIVWRFA